MRYDNGDDATGDDDGYAGYTGGCCGNRDNDADYGIYCDDGGYGDGGADEYAARVDAGVVADYLLLMVVPTIYDGYDGGDDGADDDDCHCDDGCYYYYPVYDSDDGHGYDADTGCVDYVGCYGVTVVLLIMTMVRLLLIHISITYDCGWLGRW